jgi:hypothetical protein
MSTQFIRSFAPHNTLSDYYQDSMRRFADRNAAERVRDGGQSGAPLSDFYAMQAATCEQTCHVDRSVGRVRRPAMATE